MAILSRNYFQKRDTLFIAKDLLEKYLMTRIGNEVTGGMILETEAYIGEQDKACHAYKGRYTERTRVMYEKGGVAYIYFCYGMHHLFNIVTQKEGIPHAILIRAILPSDGIEEMVRRRKKCINTRHMASGPAMVAEALGLTCALSGEPLTGRTIWVEDRGSTEGTIETSPRIGIAYAEEYALKPWRFRLVKTE